MEMMNATIKIEPNAEQQNAVSEFFIGNIKHEPTSDEPTITEFDEHIFQHSPSDQQHKELPDSDDRLDIDDGNFVFVDEIIKEEPIFNDSSDAQILHSTHNFANVTEKDRTSIHRNWQMVTEEQDSSEKTIDSSLNDDAEVHFKCQHCSETFHQKWIFDRHRKVHGAQKSFDCGLCSRKFGNKLQLIAHERIHKNQKPSVQKQLPEAARKLASKQDESVKNSAPPPKEQKSKKKQQTDVPAYQTVHSTAKSFNCNLCPRTFATKARLTIHERIHTGQQPFECEVCHKKFNHKNHVDLHRRIHTGEKPFGCAECGMRFRLKQHLVKHIEVRSKDSGHQLGGTAKNPIIPMEAIMSEHSLEIRIFECYLCRIQCYRNDLRTHMKTEHCGEHVYSCKKCAKQFFNGYKFNQHIKAHSAQPKLQCQVCGRQFLRKDSLKTHIATHVKSYQCKFCPKKLSTEHILKTHLKTHTGLRPFECDVESCTKTFLKRGDMIRHKRIHTGERPYTCDVCKKSFTRNHLLTEHKEKMHWMKNE